MSAPTVVAKVHNLIAAAHPEIAIENHVPRLEAPPLACAAQAYRDCESIPEALYTAVAEVLAYVYQ